MAALKRHRGTWVLILVLAAGFFLLREKQSQAAGTLTINSPRTFASLDNTADDCDATSGIFHPCATDLVITAPNGSITCDNTSGPANACPITMSRFDGNLEIQAGGSIHAENQLGSAAYRRQHLDDHRRDFTMRGPGGGNPGAFVSSAEHGRRRPAAAATS